MLLNNRNMKTKILQIISIITLSLVLTACGGGGGSSDTPSVTNTGGGDGNTGGTETETAVKLDTKDLNVTDLSEYTITSRSEVIKADEVKSLLLKKDVISLIDEFDTPILMGIKYKGDTEVDISMTSTAEMIVLKSPRFIGTEPNNPKELSNRIRNHKNFMKLKDRLEFSINKVKNPCPLSFKCNGYVFELANTLAYDLNIDDLYTGVK
jgi:hypothetical protein